MNRFFKTTIVSAVLAATTLTALVPAEAHHRWRHYDGRGVVAAGILGVAIGALAAGALAEPEPIYRPVYDETPRDPMPRPRPTRPYAAQPIYYGAALEPWSPEWFRYCEDKYQTFDPGTGTFVGYDGQEHFCVAN